MVEDKKFDVINSKELITYVLNFKKLIFITIFITTLITYLFFSFRPNLYESRALVNIGSFTIFENFQTKVVKIESIDELVKSLNLKILEDRLYDLPSRTKYRFKHINLTGLLEITITSNSKEETLKEVYNIVDTIKSRHISIRENNLKRVIDSVEVYNSQSNLYIEKVKQKESLPFSLAYERSIFKLTQDKVDLEMFLSAYSKEPMETKLVQISNSNNEAKLPFILVLGSLLGMFFSLFLILCKNIFFHNKT
jgi:hypothetical protein